MEERQEWFHFLHVYHQASLKYHIGIIPSMHSWLSLPQNGVQERTLLNFDKTQSLPTVRSNFVGDELVSMTRLHDGRSLINPRDNNRDVELFTALETTRHIYPWQKNEDVVVELPRLNMVFKQMPESRTFDCASISNYQLAETQYLPLLDRPKNYVICEPVDKTSNDAKLVIMVGDKIQTNPKISSLEARNFKFVRNEANPNLDRSSAILTYRLEKNGTLTPETKAARFYLSLRYLWQQRYQEATHELMRDLTETTGFTAKESEIISWIISGNRTDHDVRALAVRLHGVYLVVNNYLHNEKDPQLDRFAANNPVGIMLKAASKIYEEYLQSLSTIGEGLIEPRIELLVNQWMVKVFSDNLNQARTYAEDRQAYLSWLVHGTPYSVEKNVFAASYFTPGRKNDRNKIDNLKKFMKEKIVAQKGVLNELAKPVTPSTIGLFYDIARTGTLTNEQRSRAIDVLEKALLIEKDILLQLSDRDIVEEMMNVARIAMRASVRNANATDAARFVVDIASHPSIDAVKDLPWESSDENELSLQQYFNGAYFAQPETTKVVEDKLNAAMEQYYNASVSPGSQGYSMKAATSFHKHPVREDYEPTPKWNSIVVEDELVKPLITDDHLREIFAGIRMPENRKLAGALARLQSRLTEVNANQQISNDIRDGANDISKRLTSKYHALKNNVTHHVRNWKKLTLLKEDLEKQLKREKKSLPRHHDRLLALVGKHNSDGADGNYFELLTLAGLKKKVVVDDLIHAVFELDLKGLLNLGGSLTSIDAKNLAQETISYMAKSTINAHKQRVLDAINELLALKGQSESSIEFDQAVDSVVTLLKTKRAYEINDQVKYLVIEYYKSVLLRENQTAMLEIFQRSESRVGKDNFRGNAGELKMGEGKTSFVVPLLCALFSNDKSLNLVVLPDSLVASMAEELASTMMTSFRKHVDVLLLPHAHTMKELQLSIVRDRVVKAAIDGRAIITTKGSLRGLFLAMINHYENGAKDLPSIKILQDIFAIFRMYGRPIFDEADMALDILDSHQIASGHKFAVDGTLIDVVSSLYELLAGDQEITKAFSLPFLDNVGMESITESSWPKLKSMLVDKLLTTTPTKSFLYANKNLDKLYRDYLRYYGDEKLRRYWHEPTDKNRRAVFDEVDESDLKDIFAVIAEELNHALKLTIDKKVFIHYGPLPEPEPPTVINTKTQEIFNTQKASYEQSKHIAIPYVNGKALPDNRSADSMIAANRTIQKDLKLKNVLPYLTEEISSLKRSAGNSANYERRYYSFMGKHAPSVFQLTTAEIEAAAERIKHSSNLPLQIDLIKTRALSQLKEHEKQLRVTSFIFEFLFNTPNAMGGALYNHQTFTDAFILPLTLSDTSESVLLTLLAMDIDVLSLPQLSLPKRVAKIYDGELEPGSFIDDSGIFTGWTNYEVAKEMISYFRQHINSVEGVIFYDEHDLKMIIDRTLRVTPHAETTIKPERQIAFLDKPHTVGTNTKFWSRMKAKMSVGIHSILRDLEQGSYRLRGLGKGQTITHLVALEEDLKFISDVMKKKFGMDVDVTNFVDLFCYLIVHQHEHLSPLKWRAFKLALESRLVEEAADILFDRNSNVDDNLAAYASLRSLFATDRTKRLHQIYGFSSKVEEIFTRGS